jgi:phenylacetate-coenzyme A ligase PaaK-like adenylate-forming protein
VYGDQTTALTWSGFSPRPLSFVAPNVTQDLGSIQVIHLLESGPVEPRLNWQTAQLNNLTSFARIRSSFWQKRLPSRYLNIEELSSLPTLSRKSLDEQVKLEGPLMRESDGQEVKSYASSGSTGTPIQIHYLAQNARFNELRSLAQYIIEGRSLKHNRTFIKPANAAQLSELGRNMEVELRPSWLGDLSKFFESGHHKIIHVGKPNQMLIEELQRHPVGYLACLGSQMDWFIEQLGERLPDLGIEMWLHHSDNQNSHRCDQLKRMGIASQSIYSCSEVGPIAIECDKSPGHLHVVHSNVIVEAGSETVECEGRSLNPLLVTHLHSYATPIIRYELGDYGSLLTRCPCGHQGSTISNVFGRKKFFIQTKNGSVFFPFFSAPLQSVIAIQEIFMRQLVLDEVEVEIVCSQEISEESRLTAQSYLKSITSEQIVFKLKQVKAIDWSKNPKRLPFVSYL